MTLANHDGGAAGQFICATIIITQYNPVLLPLPAAVKLKSSQSGGDRPLVRSCGLQGSCFSAAPLDNLALDQRVGQIHNVLLCVRCRQRHAQPRGALRSAGTLSLKSVSSQTRQRSATKRHRLNARLGHCRRPDGRNVETLLQQPDARVQGVALGACGELRQEETSSHQTAHVCLWPSGNQAAAKKAAQRARLACRRQTPRCGSRLSPP